MSILFHFCQSTQRLCDNWQVGLYMADCKVWYTRDEFREATRSTVETGWCVRRGAGDSPRYWSYSVLYGVPESVEIMCKIDWVANRILVLPSYLKFICCHMNYASYHIAYMSATRCWNYAPRRRGGPAARRLPLPSPSLQSAMLRRCQTAETEAQLIPAPTRIGACW